MGFSEHNVTKCGVFANTRLETPHPNKSIKRHGFYDEYVDSIAISANPAVSMKGRQAVGWARDCKTYRVDGIPQTSANGPGRRARSA